MNIYDEGGKSLISCAHIHLFTYVTFLLSIQALPNKHHALMN